MGGFTATSLATIKSLLSRWRENGRYLPHTLTRINPHNLGLPKSKTPLFPHLLCYVASNSTLRKQRGILQYINTFWPSRIIFFGVFQGLGRMDFWRVKAVLSVGRLSPAHSVWMSYEHQYIGWTLSLAHWGIRVLEGRRRHLFGAHVDCENYKCGRSHSYFRPLKIPRTELIQNKA